MAELVICKKNKFGYCKFGNQCRRKHLDENCEIKECDSSSCDKRHPKRCYYYSEYKRCKFGEYCKYNHEDINIVKTVNIEFTTWKNKVDELEDVMNSLKTEISRILEQNVLLENKINQINEQKVVVGDNGYIEKNDNEIYKESINNIDDDSFQCEQCDFKSKRENGLKIHVGIKHKDAIAQIDGNYEVESDIDEDDEWTIKYWEEGQMSYVFQTYINVKLQIDKSDLPKNDKDEEINMLKQARMSAWIARGGHPSTCNF